MPPKKKLARAAKKSPLHVATIVIIALGILSSIYFFFKPTDDTISRPYTEPVAHLPVIESLPTPQIILPEAPEPPASSASSAAKIAIIIDDIGNRKKIAMEMINLDLNLSFSILPKSPYMKPLTKMITDAGKDLLLHLPLEPTDPKWNPGPGAILLSMEPSTFALRLDNDLKGYPFIGINNHMGSKFTANPQAMQTLLTAVKEKNLFFIDSLTSSQSVAYATAQSLGVKTAKRNVFLDNEQTPQAINKQIARLITLANKNGHAIGIGHPYPSTLKALTASKETLSHEVRLVGIHELVH